MLPLGPSERWKNYYRIPQAGALVGWSRAESYRQSSTGGMPVVFITQKLQAVPKKEWDSIVARALAER
jgi:hypothetical protein